MRRGQEEEGWRGVCQQHSTAPALTDPPKNKRRGRGGRAYYGIVGGGRRRHDTGQKGKVWKKGREGGWGSGREAWGPRLASLPRLDSDTSSPTAALAKHPSHPITAEDAAAKLNWKGMMGAGSEG